MWNNNNKIWGVQSWPLIETPFSVIRQVQKEQLYLPAPIWVNLTWFKQIKWKENWIYDAHVF